MTRRAARESAADAGGRTSAGKRAARRRVAIDGTQTNLATVAERVLGRAELSPAPHHRLLMERLERIGSGDIDRLMVLMPLGAAKSTFVSVLFPLAWFVRHPMSEVIAACHTASLAEHFGRRLRSLLAEEGITLGLALGRDGRAASRLAFDSGGSISRRACGGRSPADGPTSS